MFDARSILDILIGGAGAPRGRARRPTRTGSATCWDSSAPRKAGHGGRLRRRSRRRRPVARRRRSCPAPAPGEGVGLEELLRQVLAGGRLGPGSGPQAGPSGRTRPSGGGLQDILRELLEGGPGGGPRPELSRVIGEGAQHQGGGASVLDALKQVLGQATEGAREGATRIDEATGASGRAREALGHATGQSPEELVARLRELIGSNQLATGAALGGLGGLLLGTRAGRSLAASAIKLGGLALIGGLAYKAYQNYQQGRPILAGRTETPPTLAAAPNGSGFEPGAVSDEAARRYIRTMIAAAAADGRIDAAEQQRILGGLRQAGIEQAAQRFLTAEINSPASPTELAAGVGSPEEAIQVYTAARVAIDLDTNEEHVFLSELAAALGIDDRLAAQVDAAARGAA